MEKTQKRRSSGWFMRSLYKATVKPNSYGRSGSNKVKPSPSEEHVSFGIQKTATTTITTNFVKPNNNSFYSYEASYGVNGHRDYVNSNNNNNNYYCYYYNGGGDENVDLKAASYISTVRERFKLEKADSDQRMK